ncbi:MAG: universal stress protein [Deltaproteobacteria bacterium]|jgi:hypothetical protein
MILQNYNVGEIREKCFVTILSWKWMKKRQKNAEKEEHNGGCKNKVLKVVQDENIDLLIMLAHEEGHLEHFLFGHSNEHIIRRMPCSILLVKKEPEPVKY